MLDAELLPWEGKCWINAVSADFAKIRPSYGYAPMRACSQGHPYLARRTYGTTLTVTRKNCETLAPCGNGTLTI